MARSLWRGQVIVEFEKWNSVEGNACFPLRVF